MVQVIVRWVVRGVGGLVLATCLVYLGDAAVMAYRVSKGTAYGTVEVHQFLATSLKGNRVEYDPMGVVPTECSRSLFPQNGRQACWWLRGHTRQWE